MTDGIARFRDFTGETDPIVFAVGNHRFTAKDDIPLAHLGRLGKLGSELGDDDDGTKLLKVFEFLLEPDSYATFAKSVNGELDVTIGVKRVKDIIPWLLEQYGLRPTEEPSGSSTTLSVTGANSTAGASHTTWTSGQ